MEQKEIEIAIGELEQRVDRLRVLYDQYFMGFEKLEPQVVRKDVDRRFAVLRKENVRNTALRFRLNVVTQKYNTYSMFWTRICRQIEEGTFKRHLQKAKKRFGAEGTRAADPSIDIDISELESFEDMDNEDIDALLAEADAAVSRYERSPADTVPPTPEASPAPAPVPVPAPSAPNAEPRVQRQAALPPGAKPRVLLRRSTNDPAPAPAPAPALAPAPAPAAPPAAARPYTPAVRAPGPSPNPAPRIAPAPTSAPRVVPAAPTSSPRIAPSTGRYPVAAPPKPPMPSRPDRGVPPPAESGRLPDAAAAVPPKPRMPLPLPPPPRKKEP